MSTISDLRKDKGWSQTDLAVKSGVSVPTISRLENHEPVYKSTVILVCQALEVSPDSVEGVNIRKVSRKSA